MGGIRDEWTQSKGQVRGGRALDSARPPRCICQINAIDGEAADGLPVVYLEGEKPVLPADVFLASQQIEKGRSRTDVH